MRETIFAGKLMPSNTKSIQFEEIATGTPPLSTVQDLVLHEDEVV